MKILKVKVRVLAAWNIKPWGLVKPGSQLTSALNKIKLQVSAQEDWGTKYNANIKGKEKKGWRGKMLFLYYEGIGLK